MTFILNILITLLFVTIVAASIEVHRRREPFSIEHAWRNSTRNVVAMLRSAHSAHSAPINTPRWILGVQKYNDDLESSLDTFHSNLTQHGDTVRTSLQTYLAKLAQLSNSNSHIVSSGSSAIVEVLSQVKVDNPSAQGIINEFYRMLPILMIEYRAIATNLTSTIGNDLVSAVKNALSDSEGVFKRYMDEFNAGDGNGLKKELDYDPVLKSVKRLTDTISLKGSVTLSESQLASQEVQDALLVLGLVLEHIKICTHGLSSCSNVVLLEQNVKTARRADAEITNKVSDITNTKRAIDAEIASTA